MLRFWLRTVFVCTFIAALPSIATPAKAACVWRVTGPDGKFLYLGGSVHRLRSTDYPLPAAYNRAFEASDHLVGEIDEKAGSALSKTLLSEGHYPKGDNLKNHVDPRTYDYIRKVFALLRVPESFYSTMRPWLLVVFLEVSSQRNYSSDLGVERFLFQRAKANSIPVGGLESVREHAAVYAGLSDRQSEALLLLHFIPRVTGSSTTGDLVEAWRRGDVDRLAKLSAEEFREFPSFGERILGERNRRWIPKIESYLQSGHTYFVVVGAGHMGGPEGLLALLRARGYRIEQL